MKIAKLLLLTIALSSTALFGEIQFPIFAYPTEPNQTITLSLSRNDSAVVECDFWSPMERTSDYFTPSYTLPVILPITCIGDQSIVTTVTRPDPFIDELGDINNVIVYSYTYIAPQKIGSTSLRCWFESTTDPEPITGNLTINVVE